MKLVDSMRSVLGLRRKRSLPPAGPKPRLGAKIVKGDLRITVQAGLTTATWYWLLAQGWREQPFSGDRRAYREIPPSRVAELFDATDPDERAGLLRAATGEAEARPVVALRRRR